MKSITRRKFLSQAIFGAAGLAFVKPVPAHPIALPCASSAWNKHGLVFEPTEPWEGDHIQNFTSVAEPLGHDKWRIWYSVSGSRNAYAVAYAEGVPGGKMTRHPAVCSPGDPDSAATLAIGNLPDNWRPVQVTYMRLPDGRHRIYFWAHGPDVARYLAAESDNGRAYRVLDPLRPLLYHPNDRAATGVPSPDGVILRRNSGRRPESEPKADPHLISNDATTIYREPDGTFVMYSVALVPVGKEDPGYVPHDNAPGLVRVIDRYVSGDGLRFETRDRVIDRDQKDPADQQFYHLAVTRTARGYIGMLGHYRCQAQTMDLEWCFSADGKKWERQLRGAWLKRGDPAQPDCFGIYPGNRLVQLDGRWYLFYTGVNSAHNGRQSHGKPRQVIMLASTADVWS